MWGFILSVALAGTCGGNKVCKCGDTLKGSYTMTADLDCSSKNGSGLHLAGGAILNGNGHTISGTFGTGAGDKECNLEPSKERFGLDLKNVSNVSIQNVTVDGFCRNVRISGGKNNTVYKVNSNNGFYGIDLAGGTNNNWIIESRVESYHNEGIHIGSSPDNTIEDTTIVGDHPIAEESIYILETSGTKMINIRTEGPADSINMEDTDNNLVEGGVFSSRIQLSAGSEGNVFENMTVTGQIRIRKHNNRRPQNNFIVGGTITPNKHCIYLEDSGFTFIGAGITLNCPDEDIRLHNQAAFSMHPEYEDSATFRVTAGTKQVTFEEVEVPILNPGPEDIGGSVSLSAEPKIKTKLEVQAQLEHADGKWVVFYFTIPRRDADSFPVEKRTKVKRKKAKVVNGMATAKLPLKKKHLGREYIVNAVVKEFPVERLPALFELEELKFNSVE